MEKGFDNNLYLKLQKESILKKIETFNNKLYLELGGKLFDDFHASRVLPGFDPNVKIKLIESLKDKTEVIFCISATDIERNKIRNDLGLSYDMEVLRLIDNLRSLDIYVSAIVITLFKNQPSATKFANKLKRRGERVFIHKPTAGYPNDIAKVVSDEGYGANEFIETTKPLVVVTAPGPCSGKLATCLAQLYHEYKNGVKAGYAKYETFPVWNLPLKHPVNVAYEAATADLKDVNVIDQFHFNKYGTLAVNYNRDVAVFPILQEILKKITGKCIYESPTDMGINMVGHAITNNHVIEEACKCEIIRRLYNAKCEFKKGSGENSTVERIEELLDELKINVNYREVVNVAKDVSKETGYPTVAIKLPNGEVVTGKTKTLISASAGVMLNALKNLAGVPDNVEIISASVLKPILKLRKEMLGYKSSVICLDDILVALSICAGADSNAKAALSKLNELSGCDAHSTYILPSSEETTLKRLHINISSEPVYNTSDLFNN